MYRPTLVSTLLGRRLTRPIARLAGAAVRIGKGDLKTEMRGGEAWEHSAEETTNLPTEIQANFSKHGGDLILEQRLHDRLKPR